MSAGVPTGSLPQGDSAFSSAAASVARRFGVKALIGAAAALAALTGGPIHASARAAQHDRQSKTAHSESPPKQTAKPAKHPGKQGNHGNGSTGKESAKHKSHSRGPGAGHTEAAKHAKADQPAKNNQQGKTQHVTEGEQANKAHQASQTATRGEAPKEHPTRAEYLGEGRAQLGDFSVKLYDPVTRTLLRVDFRLKGVTACQDEAEFANFLRSRFQFLREQVMIALRSSDMVDLTDPQLTIVKRRIVARVNRAFGQPFLKSVELENFGVYESVDHSPYVRWQAAPEPP